MRAAGDSWPGAVVSAALRAAKVKDPPKHSGATRTMVPAAPIITKITGWAVVSEKAATTPAARATSFGERAVTAILMTSGSCSAICASF